MRLVNTWRRMWATDAAVERALRRPCMHNHQEKRHHKGIGPRPQFPVWYIIVAIGLMLVVQNMLFAQPFEQLPYSEFRAFLRQGQVEEVQIGEQTLRGKLRQ